MGVCLSRTEDSRFVSVFKKKNEGLRLWRSGRVHAVPRSPPVVPKKIETKLITERMEDYQLKV